MQLNKILEKITENNKEIFKKAINRTENLIMPPRAMGKMNEIGEKLCAIRETLKPETKNKAVFIMAADHGIAKEGVSAFPQEVTGQMIGAFLNEMATINALSKAYNTKVIVTDVGSIHDFEDLKISSNAEFFQRKIAKGTSNFLKSPAMTEDEAIKSILTGFDVTDKAIKKYDLDIIATGDMGIANTTSSAAIGSIITNNSPEIMTGRGTGVDDKSFNHKINIIKKSIEKHNPIKDDAIDILSKVGGFEIGAIAGSIIAAAFNKIPVVIDGIISTAGALIAYKLNSNTKDYMFAGHKSVEQGHIKMLEYLGLEPILDLGLRLGEGTGAVTAINIIEGSAAVIKEVATFEEAAVSNK